MLVLIGGLTDGPLSLPYAPRLQNALHSVGVSLVQPILSSSYYGFGVCSIEQDAKELGYLVDHLVSVRGATRVDIMGHSTGCQDALAYIKGHHSVHVNKACFCHVAFFPTLCFQVILQGCVSDRDWLLSLQDLDTKNAINEAVSLTKQGLGKTLLQWKYVDRYPISAERLASLAGRLSQDDMFSLDLTQEERTHMFGKITLNILVLWSGSDEYVPKEHSLTAKRIAAGFSHSTLVVIDNADHAVSSSVQQEQLIGSVMRFIS